MAFQLKDFASIAASMINHMKSVTSQITDFAVGGVARTLVEAPAVEIDQAYQQFFIGVKEAIPVATYESFDFARLAATTRSPSAGPGSGRRSRPRSGAAECALDTAVRSHGTRAAAMLRHGWRW